MSLFRSIKCILRFRYGILHSTPLMISRIIPGYNNPSPLFLHKCTSHTFPFCIPLPSNIPSPKPKCCNTYRLSNNQLTNWLNMHPKRTPLPPQLRSSLRLFRKVSMQIHLPSVLLSFFFQYTKAMNVSAHSNHKNAASTIPIRGEKYHRQGGV